MAKFILTKRTIEYLHDDTVKGCVNTHVLSHPAACYRNMRGRVKISVYAWTNNMLRIVLDLPEGQKKDITYQLDDKWTDKVPDTSSLVSLTADYFHPASNYREEFTAKGETMDAALTAWHEKVNKRVIEVDADGAFVFPGIVFRLHYRPLDGGWQQPQMTGQLQLAPVVYLGSMPPRWRRAWDDFCGKNTRYIWKPQDEARYPSALIKMKCTGTVLDIS
ncbi:MAG: hypothetical protein WCH98_05145 [Verrucomicrobiota bacterium]